MKDFNKDIAIKEWAELSSAYGDIKSIIEALSKLYLTDNASVWLTILEDEMFDNNQLIHQDSFYEITAVVLPYLIDMLHKSNFDYDTKCKAFSMLGYAFNCEDEIVISNISAELLENYKASIANLRDIANDLVDNGLSAFNARSDYECSFFASALFGVLINQKQSYVITRAEGGEIEFECNNCGKGYTYICYDGSDMGAENIAIADIKATTDSDFIWLHNLLTTIGSKNLLLVLPYIFGRYTCPNCNKTAKAIELG